MSIEHEDHLTNRIEGVRKSVELLQRVMLRDPPSYGTRDALLAFYDFPAEHWRHIRTTNPIESVFATVRHRTVRTKGCLSHGTTLAMVFKLITTASKTWRRLMGNNQLPKVIEGVRFKDSMQIDDTKTRAAA